jgi:sulfite reductase (NADPH) flavoprotein alpha-component
MNVLPHGTPAHTIPAAFGNGVPCLPENAPFTPEQRAYLNGFLAGLFSRSAPAIQSAADPPSLQSLTIAFGSQTGNAEALAKRLAKEAGRRGFAPVIYDLAQYPRANLQTEKNLLLITSTYGDGEPPDNARPFWEFLEAPEAPRLENVSFSVLALGDSNYPKFCECGKNFDRRLEQLGARRASPRVDCDVDYEEPFRNWMDAVLDGFSSRGPVLSPSRSAREDARPTEAVYSRKNPFPAQLITNRLLNGPGSAKEVRHFEIAFEGSGLTYEVGDALGVVPANCPKLVDEVLCALSCSGEELVPGTNGDVNVREALLSHYDITRFSQNFVAALADKTGDEKLKQLASPNVNGELKEFMRGREVIDLLLAYSSAKWSAAEFVSCLRKLQPRLYSISSSPKVHHGQVHLTVGIVRYESLSRGRKGVCSTFLADRCGETKVPVFVQPNNHFRPPADPSRPIIMVGPGTGIAPFRAFLEERRATKAKGKNWLFFGDQHAETDFLYRDELIGMNRDGILTRLDTAFSRDQQEKVYVQHRIIEHAKELFAWLEEGAHFYVCGDASRMAKDVDSTLHRVIQTAGGLTPEAAAEYVSRLKSERRYQRDVY